MNGDGHYHLTGGSMHHEDDCTLYCPLNGFRDDFGAFGGMPVSITLAAEDGTLSDITDQAQAAALAEWRTLRTKFTDTPQGNVLRELLDVHKPELWTYSDRGPVCGYCDQIGGPEREGVDWPCINYETIRDGIG